MSDTQETALFFATDKDIYDLLTSSKKKATKSFLLEVARSRGIFLSHEDDQAEIIDYFSLLPHDYNDLRILLDQTKPGARRERSTSHYLSLNANIEILRQASNELKNERAVLHGEQYNIQASSESNFRITVNYNELDYSRTRLRQKIAKETTIECKISDGNVTIRRSIGEKPKSIVQSFIDKLNDVQDELVEDYKIELSGISEPHGRTLFFTYLINNLPNFRLEDVSNIKVDQRIETPEGENYISDTEFIEGDADDTTVAEESTVEDETMLGVVRQASFQGNALLSSKEYQTLHRAGFYICKIVWVALEDTLENPKVEFEASFENPPAGTGFNYSVKGLYRKKTGGGYTGTRRSISTVERDKYLRLLEQSAKQAIEIVEGSIGDNLVP